MVTHPPVLWAQRSSETEAEKNLLFITINLSDIQNQPKLDLTSGKIKFEAKAGVDNEQQDYGFELEFYDKVQDKPLKLIQTGKTYFITLLKSQPKADYWPRLTKDKTKLPFVSVDWNKWVDEDEQEQVENENPMDGLDMSNLMGGQGGSDNQNLDIQSVSCFDRIT